MSILTAAARLSLSFGWVLTAIGCAGTKPASAEWPKEQDALVAAPHHHRVVLENDKVRVLDVTIAPGETEPLHTHRWPSVLYIMAASDFVDRDGNGKVLFDSRQLGAPLALPVTAYKPPTQLHSVENRSQTDTVHLLRIELKQ